VDDAACTLPSPVAFGSPQISTEASFPDTQSQFAAPGNTPACRRQANLPIGCKPGRQIQPSDHGSKNLQFA
jgi:hypothetical protein